MGVKVTTANFGAFVNIDLRFLSFFGCRAGEGEREGEGGWIFAFTQF